MSHNIEQRSDGQWSFVAAREPAWHRLGVVYDNADALTLETVLADLNVGDIITGPSESTVDGVRVVDPTKKMTIRRRRWLNDTEYIPLGTVGADYTVIDEATAFGFIDKIQDTGQAVIETGMLLDGGRKAAAAFKFVNGIRIGGVDPIDLYGVVSIAHDGTGSVSTMATPIRVVCQNTLTLGTKLAMHRWDVRHTKHASDKFKVEEARRQLDLSFSYFDAFQREAEALIDVEMTKRQFEAIVADLYAPKTEAKTEPARKAQQTRWDTKRERLFDLWDGVTNEDVRGTAWGGLNVLYEEIDWYRGTREAEDPTAQQFQRSLMGDNLATKEKAHKMIKQFAAVGGVN